MAEDPYESYSAWDGGQGGKEGMNMIDKRVSRRCIAGLTRRKWNLNRLGRSKNV